MQLDRATHGRYPNKSRNITVTTDLFYVHSRIFCIRICSECFVDIRMGNIIYIGKRRVYSQQHRSLDVYLCSELVFIKRNIIFLVASVIVQAEGLRRR